MDVPGPAHPPASFVHVVTRWPLPWPPELAPHVPCGLSVGASARLPALCRCLSEAPLLASVSVSQETSGPRGHPIAQPSASGNAGLGEKLGDRQKRATVIQRGRERGQGYPKAAGKRRDTMQLLLLDAQRVSLFSGESHFCFHDRDL